MLFKKILRYSLVIALLFSLSEMAFSQSAGTIGLGVKAGDPTGLSVKFYRPAAAIEVVVGRPYYFSGRYYSRKYYDNRFHKIGKFKNSSYIFHDYNSSNPVAIQVHFLKSKATKTAKELQLYYGLGPQLRSHKIEYLYRDYYGPKGNDYIIRRDSYTNIDLGLDGVFGLEYTFKDMPLSLFADINLFMELVDEVRLELQGGIGVRYNLK